jgi:hypothetical protein
MPEVIIPLGIFTIVAIVIKMVLDYKMKRRLIEKGTVDENVQRMIYTGLSDFGLSSLKWGMVLVGVGLAFLLGEFFPRSVSDYMLVAFLFLFAGAGMLVYYAIAPRMRQRMMDQAKH